MMNMTRQGFTALHHSTHWLLWLAVVLLLSSNLAHTSPRLIPAPPSLAASSWLLIDARTGHIITEHNSDLRVPPASLSKMMTGYIASQQIELGNINIDDEVRVSEKAWRKGGSKMYIEVGHRVTVEDLLRGIIIQSGNDASIAIAEHIAGSEDAFASLMNQQAMRMGMTSTYYENSTGWPSPNQYTTARDLAKLAQALIYDYPDHYKKYAEREFVYNNIRQPNRNRLLSRDSSVDGIKTGHTEEAGYCLVSSAERDGMRLIAVVMGTANDNVRSAESQKLLTYGFRFFETAKSHSKGQELTQAKLWHGKDDELSLGIKEDIWVTIPRGAQKDIKVDIDVPRQLSAPFTMGQSVGHLRLTLDGNIIYEGDLVSLQEANKGGLLRRLWHTILLFAMGFFA